MYQTMAELSEHDSYRVKLSQLGDVERLQRRDYVRVSVKLNLKYCVIKDEGIFHEDNYRFWYESQTSDISAGGMLLHVEENIITNDIIMIRVPSYELMGIPRIITAVCCRVIRLNEDNFAGIQFITREKARSFFSRKELGLLPPQILSFDSLTQNRMVNYIFGEQIRQRQKELF